MANPTAPSSTPVVDNGFQKAPTLAQIQEKVRRLTRSPSTSQLSDADLNNYINTFILYDFPEHLRTFNLRVPFAFYTNPGQDTYNTDIASFSGATNNKLYNFQNLYLTVHPPVYIAGFEALYSQSREQFFSIYPKFNSIIASGVTGTGITGPYTGTINTQQTIPPVPNNQSITLLQNSILLESVNALGIGVALVDVPIVNGTTGAKMIDGNLYDPNSAAYAAALANPPTAIDPVNTINYLSGVFTATFSSAVAAGAPINSQVVAANLTRPTAVLYYNNMFTIRPVPDQVYKVEFEVYQRPTALLATNQVPELEEYWQYIAFSVSKKIFEDKLDYESVNMIMPSLLEQQKLINRRTIVQITNQRTPTIYSEDMFNGYGSGFGGSGQF